MNESVNMADLLTLEVEPIAPHEFIMQTVVACVMGPGQEEAKRISFRFFDAMLNEIPAAGDPNGPERRMDPAEAKRLLGEFARSIDNSSAGKQLEAAFRCMTQNHQTCSCEHTPKKVWRRLVKGESA